MDINVKVPALEKLLDYTASGVGSVAGPMLSSWQAKRQAQAKQIAAEGDAAVLQIQAIAQSKAREVLESKNTGIVVERDIANTISQRIQFQEQKRQINIESVVSEAAKNLGDKRVASVETDHDWTARFFTEVQDVSSEDMQSLWARVLAGEVECKGTTSIRTLGVLKNLNQATAKLFEILCSICVYSFSVGESITDARVPSLGTNAAANGLKKYGLDFSMLNMLNAHGLIISDYNSWLDFSPAIGLVAGRGAPLVRFPFRFQGQNWILSPKGSYSYEKEFRVHGVALTESGKELSNIVEIECVNEFTQDLIRYFDQKNLRMEKVENSNPQQVGSCP